MPPPAQRNLYDADRAVGWITERTVGFLGFADQTEAVHAAWIAYRALARRLARDRAARPVPMPATTSAAVALGIFSLLVLALVVPRPIGVGFTVTGLAALAVLRIAAMTGRWLSNLSKRREKQTAGVSL